MTQDNDTAGVNDTSDGSTDDSGVMKALRKQIKDLENQLKSAPSRESVEAEIRTELERESAISEQLIALGHPVGMANILKGTLGDADVTLDSVAQALQSIGYSVEVPDETSKSDADESEEASNLARVTNLSAQVQSAAQGGDLDDVLQKIGQAETPAQLAAIMAEAGLTDSAV